MALKNKEMNYFIIVTIHEQIPLKTSKSYTEIQFMIRTAKANHDFIQFELFRSGITIERAIDALYTIEVKPQTLEGLGVDPRIYTIKGEK